jgi:hypothetical protein
MTGYVVDMEATGIIAQFMTAGKRITDVIDEAFKMYGAKHEVKKINILPEKGKK